MTIIAVWVQLKHEYRVMYMAARLSPGRQGVIMDVTLMEGVPERVKQAGRRRAAFNLSTKVLVLNCHGPILFTLLSKMSNSEHRN